MFVTPHICLCSASTAGSKFSGRAGNRFFRRALLIEPVGKLRVLYGSSEHVVISNGAGQCPVEILACVPGQGYFCSIKAASLGQELMWDQDGSGSIALGGEDDLMVSFGRAQCSELPENLLIYICVEVGEELVTEKGSICP